ncbi:MAG: BMP family ABC transporter substrate-binding protein, partial [Mesorhizobium sp.]
DQGADIIVQHTDSTAPLQVAEERKLHGFGQSSDMIKFAPNAQLTSLTDEWGPYYISRVQAALDGTWKPDNVWLGIKDGAVKLAPFTNMP